MAPHAFLSLPPTLKNSMLHHEEVDRKGELHLSVSVRSYGQNNTLYILYVSLWGPYETRGQNGVCGIVTRMPSSNLDYMYMYLVPSLHSQLFYDIRKKVGVEAGNEATCVGL